jgi:hypothetical protein
MPNSQFFCTELNILEIIKNVEYRKYIMYKLYSHSNKLSFETAK